MKIGKGQIMTDLTDDDLSQKRERSLLGFTLRRDVSILGLVLGLIQLFLMIGGGLWVAFGILNSYDRRIQDVVSDSKAREYAIERELSAAVSADSQKVALMQEANKLQLENNKQRWEEIRDQLRDLNAKQEISNKRLTDISLSLANKVDRKP